MTDDKNLKHVISAIVENQPGVLAHVSGMFAARGFNIDSLVVGRTEDPSQSRMTIVVLGDDYVLEQVRKQLEKLIHVVRVRDFSEGAFVERDLMLVRIFTPLDKRSDIISLVDLFRGKVVDVCRDSVMVELAGSESKLEAFLDLVKPFGIKELARTGVIAMQRGRAQVED
ncbi:MAG TPA: acetolactate synthase small subunit [Phycisphaerae bacterium]|nr:acetolactate synthase small subunit [Phycisphaerae bacterium]